MKNRCSLRRAYLRVISDTLTLGCPSEAVGRSFTHRTIDWVDVGVKVKLVVPEVKVPSASTVPPVGSSGLVDRIWTLPPLPVPWMSMP